MAKKISKQQLSRAISEGMQKVALEGKHVGRPVGSGKDAAELLADYPLVVEALGEDLSLRNVAAKCGVSVNTVRKVKAALSGNDDSKVNEVSGDAGKGLKATHPKSYLPLRYTAAYIHDWRRRNGKQGELLVCGHFLRHAGSYGDEAKARRCERCARDKQKVLARAKRLKKAAKQDARVGNARGGLEVSRVSEASESYFAVSLLARPYEVYSDVLEVRYYRPVLIQASSAFQALERVRQAIGWRRLPEGTEVWEVEDKRLIGAGTLSPRMVKVLSKLEANRVLLWKPHANKGGGVYNYDVLGDHTEGRALLRVSQEECVALEGEGFIESYKTVMQGGYSEPFMGRSMFVMGDVTRAWLWKWSSSLDKRSLG